MHILYFLFILFEVVKKKDTFQKNSLDMKHSYLCPIKDFLYKELYEIPNEWLNKEKHPSFEIISQLS